MLRRRTNPSGVRTCCRFGQRCLNIGQTAHRAVATGTLTFDFDVLVLSGAALEKDALKIASLFLQRDPTREVGAINPNCPKAVQVNRAYLVRTFWNPLRTADTTTYRFFFVQ